MIERVADDEVARTGERRKQADVGGVPTREDQRVGLDDQLGRRALELDVIRPLACDQARGTGTGRAPGRRSLGKPKVVV